MDINEIRKNPNWVILDLYRRLLEQSERIEQLETKVDGLKAKRPQKNRVVSKLSQKRQHMGKDVS